MFGFLFVFWFGLAFVEKEFDGWTGVTYFCDGQLEGQVCDWLGRGVGDS